MRPIGWAPRAQSRRPRPFLPEPRKKQRLALLPRRPILDRLGLLKGCNRLFNREENRRVNRAQRAAGAEGERRGSHRHVVRRLPQVIAVVSTETVPEPMQLAAYGFDVLLGSCATVLRMLDELCPRFGRVTKPGKIEGHRSLSWLVQAPWLSVANWPDARC